MYINLNLLPKEINEDYIIPEEYYKDTDIVKLDPVHVEGIIKYNAIDQVIVNLSVSGNIKLNDAITNELINYPYSIEIEENLAENEEDLTKYLEKKQNTLDIIEFLWENIVLEVPIRVTNTTDAHMKGEGWELNNNSNEGEIDPRLEKLSEIFKGGE